MTENIPQTSASDRIEAARKALALYDAHPEHPAAAEGLASALYALITPPSVGESEEQIVERLWRHVEAGNIFPFTDVDPVEFKLAMTAAVRAGIQSAHETWECEVAQRPSQEQMLRWLGLHAIDSLDDEGNPSVYIYAQHIDREEI